MKTTITNNLNNGSSLYGAQKLLTLLMLLLCFGSSSALAQQNMIESIQYNTLPGNRLQLVLEMSQQAVKPLSFTIDDPARIVFDFADTGSALPKKQQPIGVGTAQSVITISAKDRTRVILNVTEVIPYQVTSKGNSILITLDSDATGTTFAAQSKDESSRFAEDDAQASDRARYSDVTRGIRNIDFRRGENGEGRVIITLTESNIPMDISEEFGKVVVKFINADLPDNLRQSLDVLDFATPVKTISSFEKDDNVRIEIEPATRDFEHVAYQADNIFTIELKPISEDELEEQNKAKFGYTGERLSLNFQDIPVRAVLQLIADFTGLNVVVSDSVSGNLTLRLQNVPWDQALDIILKSKGLSKRESGNVMLVAPSEEIAAQEKIDLEASQAITDLAPIRSAFFTVNFAKVTELEALFSGGGGEGGEGGGSLLSSRGNVIIDERTNTLIVKDTDEVISEVRRILNQLDVPVRQVLIGSRIVIASDNFSKELGARFGVSNINSNGADGINTVSGTISGTDAVNTDAIDNIMTTGNALPVSQPMGSTGGRLDRLGVNLPAVGPNVGSIAFSVLKGGTLVDLEISAMQNESKGEVISSPRVVTADRHEAFIEQGVEIPYLSASSSGATSVEFKKAVLSIKVTPQITPDDRIIMDLTVNKDSVGQVFSGIPSIDTREVQTQVLVNNGDTIVLGGIYEQIVSNDVDKIPFLGDLPLLGFLFRHTIESDQKAELLIFVTPKILKDSLAL
ncbi:MAG: type IV pilus secretin PilQ [Gammaproteobacteria bacterium]|jgi:type IV pilus assembly protein PilQ|nr:type IV pilus secretin PilQ [Gammaproteobacteria bacterium]